MSLDKTIDELVDLFLDEDLDEITFKTLDGRIVSTTIDDDRIEQYEANDDEEYREMSLSYSDVIL